MTPRPILFHHDDNTCIGMLHDAPNEASPLGLLIVVGGPQYRVGAHRQYVNIARTASQAGFPTFRFDWCGIGDSDGIFKGVEHLGPELSAAAEAFFEETPHLSGIILWGLCEGASSILLHNHLLPSVQGCIIVNPWVDDEAARSKAQLKHYYLKRLISWRFWRSLLQGEVNVNQSMAEARTTIKQSMNETTGDSLITRMLEGARQAPAILHIASGRDQVNRSFEEAVKGEIQWKTLRQSDLWDTVHIADADHVFSAPSTQNKLEDATLSFLRKRFQIMCP